MLAYSEIAITSGIVSLWRSSATIHPYLRVTTWYMNLLETRNDIFSICWVKLWNLSEISLKDVQILFAL